MYPGSRSRLGHNKAPQKNGQTIANDSFQFMVASSNTFHANGGISCRQEEEGSKTNGE
jgi:hypothetical protein